MVISVGTAAEGIAALQNFFDIVAHNTGMAFVVTHQNPELENTLPEMLQLQTQMPVQQVTAKVTLKANHIYVLPPNHQMLITDSDLDIVKFEKLQGQSSSVNGFLDSVAAVPDEAVVITFIDAMRLKQAESVLHESDKRYRLMVESVTDYAMFTMDVDGYINTWGQGGRHIFGYKDEEIIGKPFASIFTEEERAAGIPVQELARARQDGQTRHEGWRVRRDGSRFWGSGVVTAIWDGEELHGYVKILRDNTERKQMEQALRDLNESLEERVALRTKAIQESEQQIRELAIQLTAAEQTERERIAQMLHDDLQQQLFAIQVQMALVLKIHQLPTTAAMQQDFAQLESLLSQATAMTRNLSYELSPPILQSGGLVEALTWLAENMQPQHGLQVTLHTSTSQEDELPTPDESISVLVFQVVRELLFNVVKHAGVNEATVTLEQGPEFIRIQVADQGDGFDVEQVLNQQPTGFGLATMRRRLELIGGMMNIESAPHKGTETTIMVPL